MTADVILRDLVDFVAERMPGTAVHGATDLKEDLPFDSLDRMELFLMIHKRFNVVISPERYLDDNLQVLQSLADFVSRERASC